MHNAQRFPVDVRTGWVDYSPALRYHATERARSVLAGFASRIRSVKVRIADAEPHDLERRRCEVEVLTTDGGPITVSSVGADLFDIVDRALDSAAEMLHRRASAAPIVETQRRIA